MKTWDAFQYNRPVGKIRRELARLIEEAIPGVFLNPEDLTTQNPQYSRAESDCCTWDAWGKFNGQPVHFYSWVAMGRIVKSGKAIATADGPSDFEIDPHEPA